MTLHLTNCSNCDFVGVLLAKQKSSSFLTVRAESPSILIFLVDSNHRTLQLYVEFSWKYGQIGLLCFLCSSQIDPLSFLLSTQPRQNKVTQKYCTIYKLWCFQLVSKALSQPVRHCLWTRPENLPKYDNSPCICGVQEPDILIGSAQSGFISRGVFHYDWNRGRSYAPSPHADV